MNHLSWDEYFMSVALLSAKRSKDQNTQVGACIINQNKRIVGVGYNGMPDGLDHAFPWEREGEWVNTKYPYVVHAELNAILNSTQDLKGCEIYVSLFPCCECAKALAQSGIKKIYYLSDKYNGTDGDKASKKILNACGIRYEKLQLHEPIVLNETEKIQKEKQVQVQTENDGLLEDTCCVCNEKVKSPYSYFHEVGNGIRRVYTGHKRCIFEVPNRIKRGEKLPYFEVKPPELQTTK